MKVDLFLPFLVWLLSAYASVQPNPNTTTESRHFCAHDAVMERLMEENAEVAQKTRAYERGWRRYQQQANSRSASSMEYVLPVVVHIVHENGVENIPDAVVEQGIDDLNAAFANTGYYDQGTGVPTGFQFCLARRDPDGNATNGINRIESALTEMTLENDDLDLKNLSRWDPTQYVNIWLVRGICSISSGCGVAGYAYFPTAHGSNIDGIVMEANYFGSTTSNSAVQVHEMGHYLGLYHTFQGGCLNNDCLSDGDRVCDTPPDQSTAQVPCNGTMNSCSTDTNSGFATDQNDLFINYMDYGDLDCYSAFTQGQTDRMVFTIEGIRASLLESQGCLDPCTIDIAASFNVDETTIAVGTMLNFENTSSGATAYSWFIDGILFSSGENSSFTFNDLGFYEIELIVTNSDPNCISRTTVKIEVICPIEASFSISNTNPLPGETINFTNNSSAATSYSWSVNGVQQSTNTNFNSSFAAEGAYLICLEASNSFCSDETCFYVYVSIPDDCNPEPSLVSYSSPTLDEMGWHLLPLPSGNLLMASEQEEEVVLSELDSDLNLLWNQKLFLVDLPEEIKELKLDSDGMLLGLGFTKVVNGLRAAFCFKYDYQNMNMLWSKQLSGSGTTHSLFSIQEPSPGGNYFIFGQTWPNSGQGLGCDATMIELDRATGNQIWAKNYNLGSCETFQDVLIKDNAVYVTGRFNAAGGGTDKMRPAVSLLDLDGNLQWTRLYLTSTAATARLYPNEIIEEGDNFIIFGAGDLDGTSTSNVSLFLYEINADGILQWAREYDIPGANTEAARRLLPVTDGYIILSGFREGSTGKVAIIKTNKQGVLQWAKQYGSEGSTFSRDFKVIGDHIYLTGGTTVFMSGTQDIFLAKLDLNGELAAEDCSFVTDLQVNDFAINNPYDAPINITEYNSPYQMENAGVEQQPVAYNQELLCEEEECEDCTGAIQYNPEPTECDSTTLWIESDCEFSSYYWSFCQPELTDLPEIEPNIPAGNIPVMCDFVDATTDGSGYHLFVTNYNTATERLRRLDFGNDLDANPTTTIIDLPGIPNTTDLIKNEGIDIIRSNGQYYGFFTVWDEIYRIEFGTDITNANPDVFLVQGYDNVPLWWSVSLDLYQIDGDWWGIHTARSGQLTILYWGPDVTADVQAALYYDGGNANAEFTGATYIEEGGNHYVLACDFQNGLIRFDFGESLLNPPTATNLGFFGTGLQWSVLAYRECEDSYLGFLFKETGDDHKVLRFSPSITSPPVVVNTINGLNRINGTSSFHRIEDDLVFFATRSYSQSVAQLYYEGCNGVDIPNSTLANPTVLFPEPGTYTLSVIANEGLPDQTVLCQEITVTDCMDEICDDGIDNDGNGLTDCQDPALADSCCCLQPLPLDLGPDQLVCHFGVTILDPGQDYASYEWQDGSTERTFTAFEPGIYWLTALDSCGNMVSDTIEIEVEEITILEVGPDTTICAGDSVFLAFTQFDQYEWYPPEGIDCPTCPEVRLSPDSSTTYTLVASSDLGCYSVDSFRIEVEGILTRFDSVFLCQGDTALVFGEPVFSSGTYTETVAVEDGCDSVFVSDVLVFDLLSISSTLIPPCSSTSFGSISVNPEGGRPPYTVNWSGPNGFSAMGTEVTQVPIGLYELQILDDFGCELRTSVELTVAQEVEVELMITDVSCYAESDGILDVSGLDAYQYSLDGETFSLVSSFSNLLAGAYTLYVQDANGCVFEVPFEVDQPEELLLELSDDFTIQFGDSAIIRSFTNGTGLLTYNWIPEEGLSCSDCPEPYARPSQTSLYTLVLTDENDCIATNDLLITVERNRRVYIPNAFSPNGDGINDVFFVNAGPEVNRIKELSVFDRWGELVFKNTNFPPNTPVEGWDGQFRGQSMGAAIFVYIAEVEYIDGTSEIFSGDFILLR